MTNSHQSRIVVYKNNTKNVNLLFKINKYYNTYIIKLYIGSDLLKLYI